MQEGHSLIRRIYIYTFSFIGLVLVVIGLVRLIDLGLKFYVFKGAESFIAYPAYPERVTKEQGEEINQEERDAFIKEQEEANSKNRSAERQRTVSNSLAMILVGAPLFLYHWRIISKEK